MMRKPRALFYMRTLLFIGIMVVMLTPYMGKGAETDERLVRYAIVVGANDGGDGRVPLRYAHKDARTIARVLQTFGGIDREDIFLVLEPDRFAMESAFARMRQLIINTRQSGARQEVIVYYSGHSDEQGLLLSGEALPYREFRELLTSLDTKVHIAILDSCSSGALSRSKGGIRRSPFLMDNATNVTGHAFMTSASADEAAQESDRIGGSFFTYYLTTGLRGAADSDNNRMVTLNEAYNYAFNETLARTESTMAGPQHASYDFQLKGSGDLVLTDLRGTSALLEIDKTITGQLFIRNADGQLIAEINKVSEDAVYIGMEPGNYSVVLKSQGKLLKQVLAVLEGRTSTVRLEEMQPTDKESTIVRGNSAQSVDEDSTEATPTMIRRPLQIGLFPGGISVLPLHWPPGPKKNHLAINFIGDGHYLDGLEAGILGSIRYGDVRGTQASGIFNMTRGHTNGLQAAGLFNTSGSLRGIQASGLFNISKGGMSGLQAAGLFNVAGEGRGLRAAGLFNITRGPSQGWHTAGLFNYVDGPTRGLTASGLVNVNTSSSHGFLGAGLVNVNKSSSMGFMGAGLININGGAYHGFQGAGLLNISAKDNSTGYQGAGLANIGSNVRGMQAAGIINISKESMTGLQTGLINIGGDLTGAQIGLVNVATGNIRGAQIGLVNVGDGTYFAPTFWVSGSSYTNFGFKLGGRYTYCIFGYGLHPSSDIKEKRASIIYGLGGHFDLGKFWLDIDLLAHQLLPEYRWSEEEIEHVYKVRPHIGYRLLDQLTVYAGPSVNFLIADTRKKAELIPGIKTYRANDDTHARLSIDFLLGIQWEPKFGKLNTVPKIGSDEPKNGPKPRTDSR